MHLLSASLFCMRHASHCQEADTCFFDKSPSPETEAPEKLLIAGLVYTTVPVATGGVAADENVDNVVVGEKPREKE